MFSKKHFTIMGLVCAMAVPAANAGAEGFAINEWSAEGVAMGGARMFAENDAANIAYNPASITKVQGEAFKQSAVYISPHGKYKAVRKDNGEIEEGKNVVHAGWAPGNYYVKQLNDREWFGIGLYSRFGMISEFERDSVVSSNAFFSRLNGASLTPTYARKFDKKWSAAIGAEVNYAGLELQKKSLTMYDAPTQTKGESWALGWNAAANYAFDAKNELGVVYRSKVTHSMEADFKAYLPNGVSIKTDAYGKVTLPDSWAIGYNHKFDDRTRVELNGTYTKWSSYDALDIDIKGLGTVASPKNWSNGWRYAIGAEHKLSDKYTIMGGYAYDESSIPFDGADFIVPTGARRTYSLGLQYHDKKQTLALTLGLIDIDGLRIKGHETDAYSEASTHDNYAKVFGISYQRNF
ncbi:outer membrane protein transport protein [uncultured Phascolarctobacterium sp.]|uniref:OmpP1/FadL family transporter n=1 Tax=uncultured Phascolarctobacterium sp. TaxID=512296 RepID=UPI0025D03A6A|nr:outer membrane protein transport protein [uncultured Phascolarctobacterium sp.]